MACHSNQSRQQRTSYYITEGANSKRALCCVVSVIFIWAVHLQLSMVLGHPSTSAFSVCVMMSYYPRRTLLFTRKHETDGVFRSFYWRDLRPFSESNSHQQLWWRRDTAARILATLRLQLENGNRKENRDRADLYRM